MRYYLTLIAMVTALFVGAVALAQSTAPPSASLAANSRVFKLRTYYVAPGKLEALHARFRDHTNKIFLKHGMQLVGYWVPKDKDGHYENKLVYMLAFASKEAHDQAWKDFADFSVRGDGDYPDSVSDRARGARAYERVYEACLHPLLLHAHGGGADRQDRAYVRASALLPHGCVSDCAFRSGATTNQPT